MNFGLSRCDWLIYFMLENIKAYKKPFSNTTFVQFSHYFSSHAFCIKNSITIGHPAGSVGRACISCSWVVSLSVMLGVEIT